MPIDEPMKNYLQIFNHFIQDYKKIIFGWAGPPVLRGS